MLHRVTLFSAQLVSHHSESAERTHLRKLQLHPRYLSLDAGRIDLSRSPVRDQHACQLRFGERSGYSLLFSRKLVITAFGSSTR